MSFVQWTFLFGAVAVVGPIVAHMLAKPRFRRVGFTMLQFLRTGRHESHARRNIRDLLILLLRCAIIVLIAVLFARPVLKVKAVPQPHKSIHYLALDDSASMAYQDGRSSLFERMIETAVDRVRQAQDDASFGVYGLASGRAAQDLNRSQAIAEIKRLAVVPRSARPADFVQALRQASRTAPPGDTVSATILSDFTPGVLREFERIRAPAMVDTLSREIIAPTSPASNVAVGDARAVDVVEGKLDVDVVVSNCGDTHQQRKLSMKCEDRKPLSIDVILSPGERRVVRMQMDLGPGAQRAAGAICLPVELSLAPEDGLAADDTYRLAVCIPRSTSAKVLVVHRGDETFLFETAVQALVGQDPAALSLRRVVENRLGAEDLNWADVVVFSSLPTDFSCPMGPLKSCMARGGRLIFFTTEPGKGSPLGAERPSGAGHRFALGSPDLKVSESLMREGLLAALPQKWIPGIVYPQPQPVAGGDIAFGGQAAKSLVNYRFDKIALKGHWLCRAAPDAECLWRLAGGAGFLYGRSTDGGSTILVNTSIDDSLGLLAKSGAWVAFCRLLAGEADRVRQFCFRVDERPVLNLPDAMRVAGRKLVGLVNCDGSRAQAAVEGMRMVLPAPQGTGWMKTVDEPVLYAGVNLPEGETDVGRPAEDAVAHAMKRAFVTGVGRERALGPEGPSGAGRASPPMQDRPIWKACAWATILLLLLEPAVTNRLRR